MNHQRKDKEAQRIAVFQQNCSAERKIEGVRQYGGDSIIFEVHSIDEALPPVLDDTSSYLPDDIEADLVLDFLKHRDLSQDLAELCSRKKIPIISSGKKIDNKWVLKPPT